MKFGSHSTNIERVASNILTNQKLDPSPSARTILGSDELVLNLRPLDNDKFLGHSGQFRTKPQSSIMEHLERMKDQKFNVLRPDRSIDKIQVVQHDKRDGSK